VIVSDTAHRAQFTVEVATSAGWLPQETFLDRGHAEATARALSVQDGRERRVREREK